MKTRYGFGATVNLPFENALERVTQALQDEGFGLLTEIDVQATLTKKLGEDMPPYRILGACNPPLAHRAISAEPQIGLLLPCNVVVRQDDTGQVHVELMDTDAVLALAGKPEITELAGEVRERLERVLEAVQRGVRLRGAPRHPRPAPGIGLRSHHRARRRDGREYCWQ